MCCSAISSCKFPTNTKNIYIYAFYIGVMQIKKRKLKEQHRKKEIEAERAKDEQLTRKRQREERRERYREQDKLMKKIRRHSEV